MHDEHQELQNERLINDLHAAIQVHSQLHFDVQDGEYDASYEDEFAAMIEHDPETQETKLKPVSGFKS